MEKQYSESVIEALLSADISGTIKIPCGTAEEIENTTQKLGELEKMGFLSREKGTAYYRPFKLTEHGVTLRNFLAKAERMTPTTA